MSSTPPMSDVHLTSSPTPRLGLRASRRGLIAFLAALVAIGPLSIDMYLPSLPAMRADLATTQSMAQLSIGVFLLGFCLGMVFYGPVSDRIGRRPLLLGGLALYVAGSLGCLLAADGAMLVGLRFVQALGGGAAAVLGRTMVRDLFAPGEAARILSLMQVVTMAAPLLAPIAGGYIAAGLGWRAVFGLLAAFAAGCLLLVWRALGETLEPEQRLGGHLTNAFRGYRQVLCDWRSAGLILGSASVFAGMFVFITASPFVYIEHYGVPSTRYGFLFALNILAIAGVALTNAYLVRRLGPARLARIGATIAAVAGLAIALATVSGSGGLGSVVIGVVLYIGTTGFIGANTIAMLLQRHRANAGAATAAFGAVQFGLGALASTAAGHAPGPEGMGILMGLGGVLGALLVIVATKGIAALPAPRS